MNVTSRRQLIDIDMVLTCYSMADLGQLYADVLGIPFEQVYWTDNGDDICISTQQTLSPELLDEIGETVSFTIYDMVRISRTQGTMYVVSTRKSIYAPLLAAFAPLMGKCRLKKLSHLV